MIFISYNVAHKITRVNFFYKNKNTFFLVVDKKYRSIFLTKYTIKIFDINYDLFNIIKSSIMLGFN